MIARRRIVLSLLAASLLGAAAAPVRADSPGGATPDVIVLPGPPPTIVHVGNPLLSMSADGISFSAHASALVRGRVRVAGTAPADAAGGVRIDRLDAHRGWVPVATVPVAADGGFRALWRPDRPGAIQLRAVPGATPAGSGGGAGDGAAGTGAGAASAGPQLGVTVYRPGVASWYGPGLWGTTTSCGVVLRPTTLGVAHRTLPCGTQVALYYRGRTIAVPVIDRGPFVHGRTWDLTLATFHAVGGGGEGLLTLGALALTPAPPPPSG